MLARRLRETCIQNLLLDLGAFVLFVLLCGKNLTGVAWHEWLGLAVGLLCIVHVVWHWSWVVAVGKRLLGKLAARERIHALVDIAGFLAFATALISGLAISKALMPMLGFGAGGGRFWRELHHLSSDLALVALAVHVALHWHWIVETARRFGRGALRRGAPPDGQPEKATASNGTLGVRFGRGLGRAAAVVGVALVLAGGYYGLSRSSLVEADARADAARPTREPRPDGADGPAPAAGPPAARAPRSEHPAERSTAALLLHDLGKPLLATTGAVLVAVVGGRLRGRWRRRREGAAAA